MKRFTTFILLVALSTFSTICYPQVKSKIKTRTGMVNTLEVYGFVSYMGLDYYPAGNDTLLVKDNWNRLDSIIPPTSLTIDKKPYTVAGFKAEGCRNNVQVKYVELSPSVKEIPSACFDGCHNLEECIMPGVEEIGGYAFFRTHLKRVVLPEGLKEIGKYAFYENTRLKYVELPSSLEYIGYGAFKHCQIDTLKVHLTKPCETGSDVFYWRYDDKCSPNVLLVPAGSKKYFVEDKNWKYCKTIIEY